MPLPLILVAVGIVAASAVVYKLTRAPGDVDPELDPELDPETAQDDAEPDAGVFDGKALRALSRDEAVVAVYNLAIDEGASPGWAALVASHAALETGWYEHFVDSNIFGLTAAPGEPSIKAKDSGDGWLNFRDFATVREGVAAYISWIRRKAPAAEGAGDDEDTEVYSLYLKNAGYYSAPLEQFSATLKSIHGRVSGILENAE